MAGLFSGTVWQANPGAAEIQWQRPSQKSGNDLKYAIVKEINCRLDTSRFHICVPISGKEVYVSEGQRVELAEEEYMVLGYQQEVRGEGRFDMPVKGLCLFLDPGTVAEVYAAKTRNMEQLLDHPFDIPWQRHEFLVKPQSLKENLLGRHLQKIKKQLAKERAELLVDWDEFYYGIAEAFLETHWQINRHLHDLPFKKDETRREIYRRVSRAHNFILDNYHRPIALEDTAREAVLSTFHFTRLYRQTYGITPYQHILKLRIEKAKVMLQKGVPPTEVAYELSFSDRRAFAKTFKKMTGKSPSGFV